MTYVTAMGSQPLALFGFVSAESWSFCRLADHSSIILRLRWRRRCCHLHLHLPLFHPHPLPLACQLLENLSSQAVVVVAVVCLAAAKLRQDVGRSVSFIARVVRNRWKLARQSEKWTRALAGGELFRLRETAMGLAVEFSWKWRTWK